MDADALRAACLDLPGAVEEFPFGFEVAVYKVGGKMFASSRLDADRLTMNVKADPGMASHQRATYPAITPGYHMNKKHWNTVALDESLPDSLPDDLVRELIEDSYELVVSSLTRAQRAWILANPTS